MADYFSCWASSAAKAWMHISMHGDAKETASDKRMIEAERLLEEGEAKCFVVMGSSAELAKIRDAKVQAVEAQMKEEDMARAIEGVQSVLMEDWSDNYATSDHWLKYWTAVSAPSDDDWPEGLTEDGDSHILKDKLLVPENRVEDLIDHWHNAQFMHPGRDKLQKDLESRFLFPPGYYTVLNRYCKACAVCRVTKHPNRSTVGNPVYMAIPESPMSSVSMDFFAMPEDTLEGEVFDCVILPVDHRSGYIVAVPGKKLRQTRRDGKNGGMPAEPSKENDTNFYLARQYAITGKFRTIACPPPPLFRLNGCDIQPSRHASRPCKCTSCEIMRQQTAYPCPGISRLGHQILSTNGGSLLAPRCWPGAPLRACPSCPSSPPWYAIPGGLRFTYSPVDEPW